MKTATNLLLVDWIQPPRSWTCSLCRNINDLLDNAQIVFYTSTSLKTVLTEMLKNALTYSTK